MGIHLIIGTRLVDYWSEIAVSFFRITCIILFLGIVSWRAIKKARPSRKQWYVLTIAGILGVSINHFTFFKSLEATTPVTAAYILALTPIMTGIINHVWRNEKKPLHFWIGAIVAFGGVALVISSNYEGSLQIGIGETFSFLTMISFALFLVLIDYLRNDLSSFVITFYTTFIGGIGLLPSIKEQLSKKSLVMIFCDSFYLLVKTPISLFSSIDVLYRKNINSKGIILN